MTETSGDPRPTREECIAAAGQVYGGILADPVRGAQIRAGRERLAAQPAPSRKSA